MNLSLEQENNKFNCRVAAIILNSEKSQILIHRKANQDFWMLPGGRIEFNENSMVSMKRELKEELDIEPKLTLKSLVENFFELNGKNYHEFGFYYQTTIDKENSKLNFNDEFSGKEAEWILFKWININEIKNYNLKPSFLLDIVTHIDSEQIKHIIWNEPKK